jgi:hypothetical protein
LPDSTPDIGEKSPSISRILAAAVAYLVAGRSSLASTTAGRKWRANALWPPTAANA